MTSIYLVNVGANTTHQGKARSPIMADGSWHFVSFPTAPGEPSQPYPETVRRYLRSQEINTTHADPCWEDHTYGDDCANPRATALKTVKQGDMLLFWGLLWKNRGDDWHGFTGEHGWYLLGVLRVQEIAGSGQSVQQVSQPNQERARRNAHFVENGDRLPPNHVVFLGDNKTSARFERAVDLEVSAPKGLLYQAFTTAKGDRLSRDGKPSWKSSLRSCRKMWDLDDAESRSRAQSVAEAIKAQAGFDLLQEC